MNKYKFYKKTQTKPEYYTVLCTGRILTLTLKKKWFDMIASGEKKEEYREIKPYWTKRLEDTPLAPFVLNMKKFDKIKFKNGYGIQEPIHSDDFPENFMDINDVIERIWDIENNEA